MHPITLNQEQLEELRKFIYARGIRDTDVVNEVLDHFACKMEELLNGAEAALPFERLMVLAHQSFGPTGFRPLVARYEQQIEKVMWRCFKEEFKKVLLQPQIIGASLLIALSINYLPLERINTFQICIFDFSLVAFLFIALFASIVQFIQNKRILARLKKDQDALGQNEYWQRITLSIPRLSILSVLILNITLSWNINAINLIILLSLLLLSIIRSLAVQQTYNRLEQMYKIGSEKGIA